MKTRIIRSFTRRYSSIYGITVKTFGILNFYLIIIPS